MFKVAFDKILRNIQAQGKKYVSYRKKRVRSLHF